MGTNYYAKERTTLIPMDGWHIGKSSAGWCFSLHVMPDEGINTLADWRRVWEHPAVIIMNEYGETLTPAEMLEKITRRSRLPNAGSYPNQWYASEEDMMRKNHAVPGPNGLLRHRIDGRHCIGHGEGTWDYIEGDFS